MLPLLACAEPDRSPSPAELPPIHENEQGTRYRVVEAAGGQFALVFLPEGTLWDDGAPIAVVIPPALNVNPRWTDNPTNYISPSIGIVEIQPLLPGWTTQGATTDGPADGGGAASAESVSTVVAAAADLAGYADVTVLPDRLAVHSISSAAIVLVAVDLSAADAVGIYEPPSLPEFLTVEPGAIWMDPDESADADGDGHAWNDGRNLSFDAGSCTSSGCVSDRSALAYAPDVSMGDLFGSRDDRPIPDGVLFLDRNGNGALDADDRGRTDSNGNGAIDAGEDFYAKPIYDDWSDTVGIELIYNPGILEAAAALFVEWPPGIVAPEVAAEFWAARDVVDRLPAFDVPVSLAYTEVPHGPATWERPDARLVYEALLGRDVRINTSAEVADCILGEGTYAGGPGPGVPVADFGRYAIPETVISQDVHGLVLAGLFWETFGAADRCRSR